MKVTFFSNIAILLIVCTFPLFSQSNTKKDAPKYIKGPNVGSQAFVPKEYAGEYNKNIAEYSLPWIVADRNLDGKSDFATLVYPGSYVKKMEVLDLDYDGIIDDYTFYDEEGKVSFQIIDHNKDGNADLWIQVKQGKFVQRFQRDKNGDGVVDIDRVFDSTVLLQ